MDHGPAEDLHKMVYNPTVSKKSLLVLTPSHRLNTKIEVRGFEVKDLVTDLSDGVSSWSTVQAA